MKPAVLLAAMILVGVARAAELPTFSGPAMGTTYRVTLGEEISGMSRGEVHREVELALARIDRAASTWRDDSDASRFNRAPAGEWVKASVDLVTLVEIARAVSAESDGAFDITVAPDGSGRPVGMRHVASRSAPPAVMKMVDGIAIDLGGIGPGYAVDCIGARLLELGSANHLVELGGEVRAWGTRNDGTPWRVRLRHADGAEPRQVIDLKAGEALATSTCRAGRSPLDPRTGRVVAAAWPSVTVRGSCCATADAWAVAALVMQIPPGADGTITLPALERGDYVTAPSRQAAPTGATRAAP